MSEMNIHEVLQYLPHRYPFLLIDRVLSYEAHKSLVAIKNVTINENYFVGHFPQRPVMPGVLILEALAQASGILAFKSTNQRPDGESLYFFAGIDNARFKQVVEPGDQLRLEVAVTRAKQDVWKFKGIATVQGHLVCEADLMSAKRNIKK
jgi:3-hydroxyacyl-[acyl-carrier-protein] dehydratase